MKPGEQFVILFRGLGEAETGIEDEMLACDPGGEQRGNPGLEIGDDLGRDVAFVVRERLHGLRVALHVHGDVGHPVFRSDGRHGGIEFPGRNVVDDQGAEPFDRPGSDLAAERIDRNGHAGGQPPHGTHAQLHAPPLLPGGYFVRPGTRRVAADVDDRRPFGYGLAHAALDMRRIGHTAAGEKRVGGDVQDRHHPGL